MTPSVTVPRAAFHLLHPVASMMFVTNPSTNPTAESIPEIHKVNIKSPNIPAYPLYTAAAGRAMKINPTELDYV